MKRTNLKQFLLILFAGLLTLFWVGSVTGAPPGWAGFQASEKGFPGWSEYDKDRHVEESDLLDFSTTLGQEQGFMPYEGFSGAKEGNYPGQRPNGR